MPYARGIPLELVLNDIPEKKLGQLRKKGFNTLEDLVRFAPRRYELRDIIITDFSLLKQYIGQAVSVVGRVSGMNTNYQKSFFQLKLKDEKGEVLCVTWFHQTYMSSHFHMNQKLIVYGGLNYNPNFGFSIASPKSYGDPDAPVSSSPLPVYGKVKGMSDEYLVGCIEKGIRFCKAVDLSDPVPEKIRESLGIDPILPFIEKLHAPRSKYDVAAVEKRKCAEILLPFAVELTRRKNEIRSTTDKKVSKTKSGAALREFLDSLPFELTKDQMDTLEAIQNTVSIGKRLEALVQGDVGCGKTMVAAGAAAIMASGGYQTVIMAPTTVLAGQHYKEFQERFGPMGRTVVFLGGKEKAKEKRETLALIKSGKADIIVGTHAVFANGVEYASLGLVIVDEEHRFGVAQRDKLREKAAEGSHFISMTATPIPRTLALALYGDTMTIYNIRTMPAGRKPVKTRAFKDEIKTYEAMYRQIQQGHQCYLVCPLITEANSDAMADVESLEETEEKCRKHFEGRPVRIASINGKMKQDTIQETIQAFARHEYDILLSTTIVEVGVNVPNATVMVVKNAERFGLAQLHQLRGRVGRGSSQSYCVLLSPNPYTERLQIMEKTTDGFQIAQEDLKLRGTGNLVGTAQHGIDEAVTNMLMHASFYRKITEVVESGMKTNFGQTELSEMAELLKKEEE